MSSILSPGTKKMNKENKLVPGLPSGFEDRWGKKVLLKKKLLKAIEKNFIKFGAEALETPSFEISENIGSFLAEDEANPMSDVFSFQDGEKSITLRYDLSSPLARFVHKIIKIYLFLIKDMQFKMYLEMKKQVMRVIGNLLRQIVIL